MARVFQRVDPARSTEYLAIFPALEPRNLEHDGEPRGATRREARREIREGNSRGTTRH